MATDQAEGLRRLLAPRATRHIAVVASEPGAGATTVALGLASALAMQGERVLLVDEDAPGARAAHLAGAAPRGTLAQVLAAQATLDQALGAAGPSGVAVLPAGAAGPAGGGLPGTFGAFRTVLADARADGQGTLSALAGAAHNLLVVMRPEAASITAAYARIKQLHHRYAIRHFQLVVNAAAGEGIAGAVAGNLARTASQYLGIEASWAGYLPLDPLVRQSEQLGRGVVDAYPAAPATMALRRIASSIGAWPMRAASTTFPGVASATPPTSPRIH
ncbi:hypothetical protein BKK79_28940 [Cupriavidus sp. USMAA2-4]|uniref:AAA domain-containing protein n=1 Tax=Cupriavidus malaysiensis TaxID=367825 RepID=A0ABN4TU07_9BURK|nr:hypothetical protein BKK79_28940 [Cupriavidus sp. USMAA2-4]AOZ04183.1 hypothetical protein BKK81_32655 [Cupriavidus sp. USMAHM13]AOZ10737.1 hypothetical protein BKK80_23625 [Cupriavidus malaysiensis]